MGGWIRMDTPQEASKVSLACQSCGWVVAIGHDCITLSSHIAGLGTSDFQFHDTMTIPKVAVTTINSLCRETLPVAPTAV